jgi:hypothetical protein
MVNDHHWSSFVRLKNSNDKLKIQLIVKHVIFELHESFRVPNRKALVNPMMEDPNKNKLVRPNEITISYKSWGTF